MLSVLFLSDKVKHMLIMSRVSLPDHDAPASFKLQVVISGRGTICTDLRNHPIHMLKKGRRCLFFSVPCLCLFFLLFTHLSFSLWNTLKYTDANRLNLKAMWHFTLLLVMHWTIYQFMWPNSNFKRCLKRQFIHYLIVINHLWTHFGVSFTIF